MRYPLRPPRARTEARAGELVGQIAERLLGQALRSDLICDLFPRYLRVSAPLGQNRAEFRMTRLQQVLSGHGQLQIPREVPTQAGVRRAIRLRQLCRQSADVAVCRIKLKPLGQIEKRLSGCLIVRARSLVR